MRKILFWKVLLVGLLPVSVQAQESGLPGACAAIEPGLRQTCQVVAQAVESAQPQVGVLVTGGNPTIGTASTGGLRLGVLPRVSATAKANLVYARIPDIREIRVGSTDARSYGDLSIIAPSLSGTATVGIFPGMSLAPTIGGIGSIDLLGTTSWLPLRSLASDDFRPSSSDISYGGGLRVGLIRESFTMPGASVSLMYHKLGTVAYGEICSDRIDTSTADGANYTLEQGECAPTDLGDMGEFRFDLSSWSTRAAVSKHLLGLGLSAGIGYDRFSSDLSAGLRAPSGGEALPDFSYARITDVDLSQGRWSAFVDGSFSVLVATIAVEAGWLQGADAVPGYPDNSSDFDPGDGTYFGSVGLRIAL
jgi:hypothetical protein